MFFQQIFKFDFSLMYKQPVGTYYRVLINKTIDVCGYLGGQRDILMYWIIYVIWNEIPKSLLHPCPYIVSILLN